MNFSRTLKILVSILGLVGIIFFLAQPEVFEPARANSAEAKSRANEAGLKVASDKVKENLGSNFFDTNVF